MRREVCGHFGLDKRWSQIIIEENESMEYKVTCPFCGFEADVVDGEKFECPECGAEDIYVNPIDEDDYEDDLDDDLDDDFEDELEEDEEEDADFDDYELDDKDDDEKEGW